MRRITWLESDTGTQQLSSSSQAAYTKLKCCDPLWQLLCFLKWLRGEMERARCDCLAIVQWDHVPATWWWSYPCDTRTSGKPTVLAVIWSLSLLGWVELNLNIWKSHYVPGLGREKQTSQGLNSSWAFWVKTNLKMQMQSLWSRGIMRGRQRSTVYLLLRLAGPVFTPCTQQRSYCTSFLLLWHCLRESLSAPHVRGGGVEKPLPENCSICSTLQKCFWCWYQTVPLSSLVFHSMLITLGVGKPLACAILRPAREEEVNEAENLSWEHQEELLPACVVGWREGAVSTSQVGEELQALLKLFLRSEGKDYESRPVLLSPCFLAEPHLFIQVALPGFISF